MRIDSSIQRLATGLRINSASDDAAGLSISQGMTAQSTGLDRGIQNAQQSQDALRTAEGAAGQISESLQRMRELALQASNGILTGRDRSNIQSEIDALKSNISDITNNTQFNTRNLTDGTFQNMATASQPDGSGQNISVGNMTLESLGLADFDITQNLDISAIDAAISQVNEARSNIGSQFNALEFNVNNNQVARENTFAANSRIADADIAQEMTRLSQASIIQQYQQQMQVLEQEREENQFNYFL